ncbi:MAG: matrixin family metalloprotease, partial [Cyanobacteria bacterium J06636_16]
MAFHTQHIHHDDAAALPHTIQNAGFTGNTYVDGILWGGNHYDNTITYSFWSDASLDDAYEAIDESNTAWLANEVLAMQQALTTWSNVANINFVQAADNDPNADLKFSLVSNAEISSLGGFAGYFAPPGTFGQGIGYFNYQIPRWNTADLQPGGFGFSTLIHELGHGLGLAHPHDTGGGSSLYPGVFAGENLGLHNLNQGIWTTMSYNHGWESQNGQLVDFGVTSYGYEGTPMAFDIAAIQHLYGANLNYRTGDDVYLLPIANGSGAFYSAIWDAGGVDTIMSEATFANVTINLNDAPLVGANAGGYVSTVGGVYGGFTIAHDVTIENAYGSWGNDTLTGNEVGNFLAGRSGNDTLDGAAGNDVLGGGFGSDLLLGGEGNDALYGRGDNDFLYGEAGDDVIEGGDGDDLLAGQTGNDILYGEAGNDVLGGGFGIDSLFGGEGNDALYGRGDNDFLYGEAGDDVIEGGDGADLLAG